LYRINPKLSFASKKTIFIIAVQLLVIVFCIGCSNKTTTEFSNWPYNIEGVYGSKVFVHNPVDGLLIDVKEKKITKLFDSEKVNATRVQGSTIVLSDISPDYKHIVFRFDGGDVDLIDKNEEDDHLQIYNVEAKKLKTLVSKGGYNALTCWSKDGSKFIFSSDRLDSVYIYDVKSDKSEKIERPKGKLSGNIIYTKDKYILCVIDSILYQYSDNGWNKILDKWQGKIYSNSAEDCYLVYNNEVSKFIPKTRQVEKVYKLPVDSKEVLVRNSKDMFAFLNNNQLHLFDTLSNKEILFKAENKFEDIPLCYISPNKDKVLMNSFDDKITVASVDSSKIYEYDKGKNLGIYPAGWYDNNSFVLVDGANVKNPKVFNLKTKNIENLIR